MTTIEKDFIDVLRLYKDKKGIEYVWMAQIMEIEYTILMSVLMGDKHLEDLQLLKMHKRLSDSLNADDLLLDNLIKLQKKNHKEEGSLLDVNEDLNLALQLVFIYLIQEKGVSQAHLARKSGIARQNFNRWLLNNFVQNRTLYKLLRSIEHTDSNVQDLKHIAQIKLYTNT